MFDIIFLLLLVSGFLIGLSYPIGLEPLYFNPWVTLIGGIVVSFIYISAGFFLSSVFWKKLSIFPERSGANFYSVLRKYRRAVLTYRLLSLVIYAVQIYLLHYQLLIYLLGLNNLVFVTNFLILLPFFLNYLLGLIPFYKPDCFLKQTRWKLSGYLVFHIRSYFLLAVLPLLIMLLAMDVIAYNETLSKIVFLYPFAEWFIGVAVMLLIVLSAPFMLMIIWNLKPLEPTALKERLINLARQAKVHLRDILVWPIAQGQIANALAVGLLPGARYVVFTDGLLKNLSAQETTAVFGHEIGHIKQHHILFYLIMMLGYIGLAVTSTEVLNSLFGSNGLVASGVFFIFIPLYWGLIFGLISRRLEHQADLYGAAVTDAETFSRALDKIARLNTISPRQSFLQHPSIEKRIRFLSSGEERPARQQTALFFIILIFILAISGTSWVMVRQLRDVPRRAQQLHQQQMVKEKEKIARGFLLEEKYKESLEEIKKLTKLKPDEPLYFIWLGDALRETGLAEEARAAYQKAQSLNPRHPLQRLYLKEVFNK